MSMKIIKHGKLYQFKRVITCDCGCEFEIEYEDIKDTKEYHLNPNTANYRAKCPECENVFLFFINGDQDV